MVGLTHGAEVLKEIPDQGLITYENVRLKPSLALDLKRQQDCGKMPSGTTKASSRLVD